MAEGPELSTVSREFTAGPTLLVCTLWMLRATTSWSRYPFIHAQPPQKRCGSWFVLSFERTNQETPPRGSEGTRTGRFVGSAITRAIMAYVCRRLAVSSGKPAEVYAPYFLGR